MDVAIVVSAATLHLRRQSRIGRRSPAVSRPVDRPGGIAAADQIGPPGRSARKLGRIRLHQPANKCPSASTRRHAAAERSRPPGQTRSDWGPVRTAGHSRPARQVTHGAHGRSPTGPRPARQVTHGSHGRSPAARTAGHPRSARQVTHGPRGRSPTARTAGHPKRARQVTHGVHGRSPAAHPVARYPYCAGIRRPCVARALVPTDTAANAHCSRSSVLTAGFVAFGSDVFGEGYYFNAGQPNMRTSDSA